MPLALSTNVRLAVAVVTALALALALGSNRAQAASGDFSIDFAAAAPSSYDHATGGGAFNDRTINEDVVESLNGGDFSCGDLVSFLPRVTVAGDAAANQTITMDFSFGASTTGGGEVGYGDIVSVAVNRDVGDTGNSEDGGSTAAFTETPPSSPFT
ncbi:MAG: hypothetical protein OER93_07960, partial [Thermoleophilia bacterium]|nr:hypothetical protein [Thermoleophilia bacterium]